MTFAYTWCPFPQTRQWKYHAACIINQSSIGSVVPNTLQTKQIRKMALAPATILYCLSRAQRGESILSQLCWWKICLSRSDQWDRVIEIEPAIHACYATQGTCLSRLVALPWISKDISLHHCATDVRLYVWPYRIFLVTQTTNRVFGSSSLAKRSACSLVFYLEDHCTEFNRVCFSVSTESSTIRQSTKEFPVSYRLEQGVNSTLFQVGVYALCISP